MKKWLRIRTTVRMVHRETEPAAVAVMQRRRTVDRRQVPQERIPTETVTRKSRRRVTRPSQGHEAADTIRVRRQQPHQWRTTRHQSQVIRIQRRPRLQGPLPGAVKSERLAARKCPRLQRRSLSYSTNTLSQRRVQ